MAKLYFYYASMNAGKSTNLLQANFNYGERGMRTMLWTAALDTRTDQPIASRIGLGAEAHRFGPGTNLWEAVIAQHRGSLNAPTGLAFDRVQRLWVANHENGTLVRYDPEQLAVSGAPAPAVVVSGLGHPTALAFDASGSLWVTDNVAATVSGYRPEQLTASGSAAPAVVLRAVAGSKRSARFKVVSNPISD